MIDIRLEARNTESWLTRQIAKSDFLWDSLTNNPDVYCNSIQDLEENSGTIRDGRSILLQRTRYEPCDSPDKYLLGDCTGQLEVSPGIGQRGRLASLDEGSFLYDVFLVRKGSGICLADFEVRGPICLDTSSAEEYLITKFPRLIPVLAR